MRPDLYQAETARIAAEQRALLDQARSILGDGRLLSPLEQAGLLHALQVLTENAIGKAKQILKRRGLPVPVSAYDTFAALAGQNVITQADVPTWNAIVGLRNRIVHDYMNIDMQRVISFVESHNDQFVIDFLLWQEPN